MASPGLASGRVRRYFITRARAFGAQEHDSVLPAFAQFHLDGPPLRVQVSDVERHELGDAAAGVEQAHDDRPVARRLASGQEFLHIFGGEGGQYFFGQPGRLDLLHRAHGDQFFPDAEIEPRSQHPVLGDHRVVVQAALLQVHHVGSDVSRGEIGQLGDTVLCEPRLKAAHAAGVAVEGACGAGGGRGSPTGTDRLPAGCRMPVGCGRLLAEFLALCAPCSLSSWTARLQRIGGLGVEEH